MKIFAVYGDYCMGVYAANDREEAYRLFLEKEAFRFDDLPLTIDDLSYPYDGIRAEDMVELDTTKPGYIAGYVE